MPPGRSLLVFRGSAAATSSSSSPVPLPLMEERKNIRLKAHAVELCGLQLALVVDPLCSTAKEYGFGGAAQQVCHIGIQVCNAGVVTSTMKSHHVGFFHARSSPVCVSPVQARLRFGKQIHPVSITLKVLPFQSAKPYCRSRVTPLTSSTIAFRCSSKRLNSVDFPTLGRPTIATVKPRHIDLVFKMSC